ncbi:histidinol-phosphatase [Rosistilla oblonga]|uniref:histidinol-phosphatase n=1 Tax=Rosistilla oblonga TaxID=2527990 RepID=UPI0011A623BA|nr:histidinol-phosphatase [Rosistilla oblonga]
MTTTPPSEWSARDEGRVAAMIDLAHAAGQLTLNFFGDATLAVDRKGDASPVTEADRSAERLIRQRVAESYGDDAILGEEFADTQGSSGYRWIVDPIDGTKSFICGVPLYSTIVAVEKDDQVIAGAIVIPALGESIVAAIGSGAWHRRNSDADWTAAHVSPCDRIEDAVFLTSQVDSFANRGAAAAYDSLQSAASITRSWGDAYGYLLVATGRADIMVDPIVNPYDVAAVQPVLTEAGGQFSDWKGNPTIRGGDAFGTNGKLHAQVLSHLGG